MFEKMVVSLRKHFRRRRYGSLPRACALSLGLVSACVAGRSKAAIGLMKDWHLEGQVGRDGWRGVATYTLDHGYDLHLKANGDANGDVNEVGTAVTYNPKEGPGFEVAAGYKSGTKEKVLLSMKVKQRFTGLPVPVASLQTHIPQLSRLTSVLGATMTQSSVALDAQFSQPVSEELDLSMRLRLKRAKSRPGLIRAIGTEVGYKVGGGKLVGSLTTQSPGGTRVLTTYRLG